MATSGEVALLEVTPLQAANDSAEEDDSDVELEFDWQPVSIIEICWIHLYYEFIYNENSLIYEFTYMNNMQPEGRGMGVVQVSHNCHLIFLWYVIVYF